MKNNHIHVRATDETMKRLDFLAANSDKTKVIEDALIIMEKIMRVKCGLCSLYELLVSIDTICKTTLFMTIRKLDKDPHNKNFLGRNDNYVL